MPLPAPTPAQARMLAALRERRFFKLICGGSFTEAETVFHLAAIYAQTGVDCIDIAPDGSVLESVERAFAELPEDCPRPVVMVSVPLDPDPHFRKIELREPDCVLCDACVPVCPTNAILSDGMALAIEQPLCYGCGRCVEVCPTQALVLNPFQVEAQLKAVLSHPLVEAVEIHTRYADPYMLPDFLERYGEALQGKLVSVCFRPDEIAEPQWLAFLEQLEASLKEFSPELPLILQIDGKPMSGSEDPHASLPALESAKTAFALAGERFPLWTISGGINGETAELLRRDEYAFIAGVGMGTVARRKIWNVLHQGNTALSVAADLVKRFQRRCTSAIIVRE